MGRIRSFVVGVGLVLLAPEALAAQEASGSGTGPKAGADEPVQVENSTIDASASAFGPSAAEQDAANGGGAAAVPGAPPRVGLVLSSGGAHALAHIGALEALEELRVPVDFVVGSEMGALIGSLYAAGMPASEVRALVYSESWVDALSGGILRRRMSWRQRTVDRDFLVDLPVSFGPDGLGLADGVSRTRWISWLLSSATVELARYDDFDRFPIPFRAIAVDLLTGERVEFGSGDVSTAVVASLATPGWYPPVEVGSSQYGSGALADPLPVETGVRAGCEVLIVVDSALEVDQPERLESFVAAATQAGLLAGEARRQRSLRALREGDIHVVPDVGDVDESDLRSADEAIEMGRRAVLAAQERLAPYALDQQAWEAHVAARHARRPVLPVLRSVRFEDNSGLSDSVLRSRLGSEPGERLEAERLNEDLLRLYGLDYHERIEVDLRTVEGNDDLADLVIHTRATEDAAWNPRAGAAFEGVFGEDATFVIGASFAIRPLDGRGSEWRNRIEVGSRVRLMSEYMHIIDDDARWFVAPAVEGEFQRVNLTIDEKIVAAFDGRSAGVRLDVGRVLGEWGELRLGVAQEWADFTRAIGDPAQFGRTHIEQGFLRSELQVDTLDSLSLPSKGVIGRVVYRSPVGFLDSDDEQFLQAQLDHAISRGRTTILFGGEYATALADESAVSNAFDLGGFLRLSGLGRDSISGAHAGLFRLAAWRALQPPRLEPRTLSWYVGASFEAGTVWNSRDDIDLGDLRPSGSMFVALESLLGPAFAGVGLTDPGEFAVFLTFGNQFGDWDVF